MTNKQKITLILFAQNYSLRVIAKKQGVSLSTIRERIKSVSKHYPIEFANTIALRDTYKRNRELVRKMKTLDMLDEDTIDEISHKSYNRHNR